ncbi:asparaginase [Alcaligenes faecalis]|uniref:asparaginase n=1 Tax=Alcaligenes faecalis TaxID=511 RepID=UPI0029333077|nr:asparaginase [Alcaligenes faecalis]MDV2116146.1 asparaginase [Alcaligenes faecalis]
MPTRPKLALVGTGGTIAATAQSTTGLTDYDITQGVHTLLQAVPGINELADLECHQVFNVDSRAMGSLMLLELSHKLNELLARPDINGAVVTHGTDTLEESAFFLHLTLKTDKPVVMVAAMRPASALSADGPLNLYQAVQVACSSLAQDQGVLVLLNDQIHSARFLSKQHTTLTSAFGSPDAGPLGLVAGGQPRFMMRSLLPHTHNSLFDVRSLHSLPKVQIFYDHPDTLAELYRHAAQSGVQGIVVAATGNGSLTPGALEGISRAHRLGVVCVRASRIHAGPVTDSAYDQDHHTIAAHYLPAQKARILLMLCLASKLEHDEIEAAFRDY